MIPSLTYALKSLQLTDKQVAVMNALLESGMPLFVSTVAKSAGLNRTTTYDVLKELSEKGLVSRVQKKGVLRYESLSADLLPSYVERQVHALEESKKQFAHILPQIKLFQMHGKTLPKVQFFEGIEGVKQAYEDTLENNKSKKLYSITGTDALYQVIDEAWMEYYWAKRVRLGIHCTTIAPDTAWSANIHSRDEKMNRITKLIPKEYLFDSEIDIYDNKVGIFTYTDQHPIAVIIEDDVIHATLQTLFNFMLANAR